MSLTTAKFVFHRRWQGSAERALPIGAWLARISQTGNASGGDQSIDFQFALASAPALNSNMYSVEQLTIDQSQAADTPCLITVSNMDLDGDLAMDQRWTVRLEQSEGGLACMRPRDSGQLQGTFIGSQRVLGIDAILSIIMDNVNGNVLRASAQGYYWSPRSVLVDGGPQRPRHGIYGL